MIIFFSTNNLITIFFSLTFKIVKLLFTKSIMVRENIFGPTEMSTLVAGCTELDTDWVVIPEEMVSFI